jgi:hypothetical protein
VVLSMSNFPVRTAQTVRSLAAAASSVRSSLAKQNRRTETRESPPSVGRACSSRGYLNLSYPTKGDETATVPGSSSCRRSRSRSANCADCVAIRRCKILSARAMERPLLRNRPTSASCELIRPEPAARSFCASTSCSKEFARIKRSPYSETEIMVLTSISSRRSALAQIVILEWRRPYSLPHRVPDRIRHRRRRPGTCRLGDTAPLRPAR